MLSGGPCAGKTKSLKIIEEELIKYGYDVFVIKESAKALIDEGFDRNKSPYEFQKAIALKQLKAEEDAKKLAQNSKNPVIISDRGMMDCRVYLDDNDFSKIKKFLKMSDIDLRDRYDAVFHLDSVSDNENAEYKQGEIRIENEAEASKLNERSLKAWCGNPHYRFIPACDTYEEKKTILLKEIKHFLGIPKPLEIERKYLIKYPDIKFLLTLPCQKVNITQSYMTNGKERFRLRKRGNEEKYIYIKTEKKKISETIREEIETRLTESEYEELLTGNIVTGSISKERYCLMYNGTYYEIDVFPFWQKQAYLEVELLDENDRIFIPEFLQVIEEVTYKPEYKNVSLCQRIPKES
jgi:CYTH domain-containing protein/predicted ATPase